MSDEVEKDTALVFVRTRSMLLSLKSDTDNKRLSPETLAKGALLHQALMNAAAGRRMRCGDRREMEEIAKEILDEAVKELGQ